MSTTRWLIVASLITIPAAAWLSAEVPTADEVAAELAAAAAWEADPVHGDPWPAATPRGAGATVFFSDFNATNGGLSGTRDWEWGTAYSWTGATCTGTFAQPPGPYSGVGMWGTVLNSCHNNLGNNQGNASGGACANTNPADDSILSLTVDLTNYTAATVSWYEWFDVFTYFDWGEVRVNNTSALIYCASSYTAPTAWVPRTVDLTPFVGGVVTVEWHFMASTVVERAGWYVDDVLVDGTPVPVELQAFDID